MSRLDYKSYQFNQHFFWQWFTSPKLVPRSLQTNPDKSEATSLLMLVALDHASVAFELAVDAQDRRLQVAYLEKELSRLGRLTSQGIQECASVHTADQGSQSAQDKLSQTDLLELTFPTYLTSRSWDWYDILNLAVLPPLALNPARGEDEGSKNQAEKGQTDQNLTNKDQTDKDQTDKYQTDKYQTDQNHTNKDLAHALLAQVLALHYVGQRLTAKLTQLGSLVFAEGKFKTSTSTSAATGTGVGAGTGAGTSIGREAQKLQPLLGVNSSALQQVVIRPQAYLAKLKPNQSKQSNQAKQVKVQDNQILSPGQQVELELVTTAYGNKLARASYAQVLGKLASKLDNGLKKTYESLQLVDDWIYQRSPALIQALSTNWLYRVGSFQEVYICDLRTKSTRADIVTHESRVTRKIADKAKIYEQNWPNLFAPSTSFSSIPASAFFASLAEPLAQLLPSEHRLNLAVEPASQDQVNPALAWCWQVPIPSQAEPLSRRWQFSKDGIGITIDLTEAGTFVDLNFNKAEYQVKDWQLRVKTKDELEKQLQDLQAVEQVQQALYQALSWEQTSASTPLKTIAQLEESFNDISSSLILKQTNFEWASITQNLDPEGYRWLKLLLPSASQAGQGFAHYALKQPTGRWSKLPKWDSVFNKVQSSTKANPALAKQGSAHADFSPHANQGSTIAQADYDKLVQQLHKADPLVFANWIFSAKGEHELLVANLIALNYLQHLLHLLKIEGQVVVDLIGAAANSSVYKVHTYKPEQATSVFSELASYILVDWQLDVEATTWGSHVTSGGLMVLNKPRTGLSNPEVFHLLPPTKVVVDPYLQVTTNPWLIPQVALRAEQTYAYPTLPSIAQAASLLDAGVKRKTRISIEQQDRATTHATGVTRIEQELAEGQKLTDILQRIVTEVCLSSNQQDSHKIHEASSVTQFLKEASLYRVLTLTSDGYKLSSESLPVELKIG